MAVTVEPVFPPQVLTWEELPLLTVEAELPHWEGKRAFCRYYAAWGRGLLDYGRRVLLPQLAEQPRKYDFIILDPPAFTKSRRTIHNAMTGYKEINYRAMKLLPRGGYLATCSCSHFASEALFVKMLRDAARDAGVQLRQIEARQQCADHPILWGVEETNYLKFFIFQVV